MKTVDIIKRLGCPGPCEKALQWAEKYPNPGDAWSLAPLDWKRWVIIETCPLMVGGTCHCGHDWLEGDILFPSLVDAITVAINMGPFGCARL